MISIVFGSQISIARAGTNSSRNHRSQGGSGQREDSLNFRDHVDIALAASSSPPLATPTETVESTCFGLQHRHHDSRQHFSPDILLGISSGPGKASIASLTISIPVPINNNNSCPVGYKLEAAALQALVAAVCCLLLHVIWKSGFTTGYLIAGIRGNEAIF
ncbi:hypothetical protein AC578_4132 [Pseudocercospora eumusae]|uniref:Uncharacterized protein n=1 Tax=Pseudocercospora eumusae TaxID=321146 RepID=A0A139HF46_9PEZI|nr:hypothetical protein AC578_4132 [Pseudocercospora eumusae]